MLEIPLIHANANQQSMIDGNDWRVNISLLLIELIIEWFMIIWGMALGTVISLPFSGILADQFGWQWIFYVQGLLAVAWCLAWALLVFDSPAQHPRIHEKELQLYLTTMEAPTHAAVIHSLTQIASAVHPKHLKLICLALLQCWICSY